jgi:hypothetical protein
MVGMELGKDETDGSSLASTDGDNELLRLGLPEGYMLILGG